MPTGQIQIKHDILLGQPLSPDTLELLVALWKAILFLPFPLVVFAWCGDLWGDRAAWLAFAIVLVEPTITGHIAPAALDVLGMEGVVIAAYASWRAFEAPSHLKTFLAGLACAAALLMKHTAAALPLALASYPFLSTTGTLRQRIDRLLAIGLLTIVMLWPLTRFDFSRPGAYTLGLAGSYTSHWSVITDVLNPLIQHRFPAGIYIGSLYDAANHVREGHDAFLNGNYSSHGWWYYLPAVALYKVPLPIFALLALSLISFAFDPPRRREWCVGVPFIVLAIYLMASRISIGFRHALPAYAFMLLLCVRAFKTNPAPVENEFPQRTFSKPLLLSGWAMVVIVAVHGLAFWPDYFCYTNFPRREVELDISDSNLDWGQSLKQIAHWLKTHPTDRPIWVAPHCNDGSPLTRYYLPAGTKILERTAPPPHHGILIISPVLKAGPYEPGRPYRFLWGHTPIATIGHCDLVYDLDRLNSSDGTSAAAR